MKSRDTTDGKYNARGGGRGFVFDSARLSVDRSMRNAFLSRFSSAYFLSEDFRDETVISEVFGSI